MTYAKINNNTVIQYPYGLSELMADNPYTKYDSNIDVYAIFPHTEQATIHGASLVQVEFAEQPVFDNKTQKLQFSSQPILQDGKWIITSTVVSKTLEEQQQDLLSKSAEIRQTRTRLLQDSDWTQVLDAPVDKAAWATYRQQLRDITQQPGFPWTVAWPQQPE